MIAKCISTYPTEAQINVLGSQFHRDRSFGVILGREYIVLGLTMDTGSQSNGGGAWIRVLLEPEVPMTVSVPLCLFEIVDPRASRYWEIRSSEDGVLRLLPRSFYRAYYHEDLSDRDPEIVKDFWRVYALLEAETKEPIRGGWSID